MHAALFPFVTTRAATLGRTPIVEIAGVARLGLLDVRSEERRVLYREDLSDAGLDPVTTYLDACARLARAVRARLVNMWSIGGPWGERCLAFGHPFLGASCLALPDLYERCHARLRTEAMCIMILRRDLVIVAPDLGPPFRLALRDVFAGEASEERCPMLRLEPSGPTALHRVPWGHPRSAAYSLHC